jgi:hypothetical protein
MTKEELMQELQQKEELKAKTELIHQQLTGQIALLRDLLTRELQQEKDKKEKEKVKKPAKE